MKAGSGSGSGFNESGSTTLFIQKSSAGWVPVPVFVKQNGPRLIIVPSWVLIKKNNSVVESIKIPCEAVRGCLNSTRFFMHYLLFVVFLCRAGPGGGQGVTLVKTEEETAKSFFEFESVP